MQKEKNIIFPEENILYYSIKVEEILLKNKNLKKDTIISYSNLYKRYTIFFVQKIISWIKNNKNNINEFKNFSLLDEKNIQEFLNIECEYNENTKGNRYHILIRILKLFYGEKKVHLTKKLFSEKKTIKKNIINDDDLIIILKAILFEKDCDIFILWNFCFNLGLNIIEASTLRISNFHLNTGKITIYRGDKFIRRNLNIYIFKIIESIIKEKNLKMHDYLLYNNINNNEQKNRNNIFKIKIQSFLNKTKDLSQETKKKILNLFLSKRKSKKMKKLEIHMYCEIYKQLNEKYFIKKSFSSFFKEIRNSIDFWKEKIDNSFLDINEEEFIFNNFP